jgi:competence protein ComEC
MPGTVAPSRWQGMTVMRVAPWKLVVAVSYGVLTGLAIGRTSDRWTYVIVLAIAALCATALHRKKYKVALVWTVAFSVMLGMWRAQAFLAAESILGNYAGSTASITGRLRDDPTLRQDGKRSFVLDDVSIDAKRVTGRVFVMSDDSTVLRRSDVVQVSGVVSGGMGGYVVALYDASTVLIRQDSLSDTGLKVRDWFARNIRSHISEPNASLGLGFLVGEKSSLPEEMTINLRLTGLTHIVVASGFNLTILVIFLRKVTHRVSRYFATATGMMSVLGFLAVSGASPSMVRASIVTTLSLIAWYFGRTFIPMLLIGIVAACTAFVYPEYIWGDVGWYLSFLSFVGVLMVAPRIEQYFFGDKEKPNPFRSALIESVSALLLTLPYSVYTFGQLSFVAVLANMLIVPLVPLAMLATFTVGIFSWLPQVLLTPLAWIAESILRIQIWLVDFFAQEDPGFTIESYPLIGVIIAYSAVGIGYIFVHKRTTKKYLDEGMDWGDTIQ